MSGAKQGGHAPTRPCRCFGRCCSLGKGRRACQTRCRLNDLVVLYRIEEFGIKLSPGAGAELLDPLAGGCLISRNGMSGVFYFSLSREKIICMFLSWISGGKRASPAPSPQDRCSSVHTCERVDFIANGFCCLALMGLCTEVLPETEGAAAAPPEPAGCCACVCGLALCVFLGSGCEVDSWRGWKRGWLCPGGDRTCL